MCHELSLDCSFEEYPRKYLPKDCLIQIFRFEKGKRKSVFRDASFNIGKVDLIDLYLSGK
ncbi:hypothetical protein TcasGA2_TC011901 [Tribolium castaneum]|uniref:Uncharacterized protein n=1 Tax=Tribolium castaneum TaxID=7070 RepID=D6WZ40_TRICA|nr:hypothetical protein TcasGA2_TC011901 [Tribolium castaneum]